MVVFPGEGAVEGFVERFAVLLVPFDGGQDHLRGGRDLEGRGGGGMERSQSEVREKREESRVIDQTWHLNAFICHEMTEYA